MLFAVPEQIDVDLEGCKLEWAFCGDHFHNPPIIPFHDPGSPYYGPGHVYSVEVSGRYYGEGYARGDFPIYKAIAEWIEARFDRAVVFYGGDYVDPPTPFGQVERAELWLYWLEHGREDWYLDKPLTATNLVKPSDIIGQPMRKPSS